MLRYSDHARRRKKERRITEEEIQAVIDSPSITSPGKPHILGPTLILWKTVNGRRLKVVVPESDSEYVVTVAAVDE